MCIVKIYDVHMCMYDHAEVDMRPKVDTAMHLGKYMN